MEIIILARAPPKILQKCRQNQKKKGDSQNPLRDVHYLVFPVWMFIPF